MQARVASLLRDAAQKGDWTTVSAGQVQSIVEEFQSAEAVRDRSITTDLRQISSRGHAHARRQDGGDERPDFSQNILNLSAESVGNAHYDVAVEVARELQWTSEEVLSRRKQRGI